MAAGEASRTNAWARIRSYAERVCVLSAFCVAMAIASPAQTFTTLKFFNGTNGESPFAAPVEGLDGNLYGTTQYGGTYTWGTVYKLTPTGTYSRIHNFCKVSGCPDGAMPLGGLVQGTDGWLYGTTWAFGAGNGGTDFRINTNGQFQTLNSFCMQPNCTDGDQPQSTLVQGSDGYFYGTSLLGGQYGQGTIFKTAYINFSARTVLYDFCGAPGCPDGDSPRGALVQGPDGSFYGTTELGGVYGDGTVFRFNPVTGGFATLHSFCTNYPTSCPDGGGPWAGVVLGNDGNIYGTTGYGGPSNSHCNLGCGTVFQLTPDGTLKTLHDFDWTDGSLPVGLLQASDGNFYGTTNQGGAYQKGNIFQVKPDGTFAVLYSFVTANGTHPNAGLMQKTDGAFYGTTNQGPLGTIFRLSMPTIGPFVKTLPLAAPPEYGVNIVGTNLTGTTAVTFNGLPATFTVASPTLIYTAVPIGATSGPVQVTTPTGTLTSNVPFQVLP